MRTKGALSAKTSSGSIGSAAVLSLGVSRTLHVVRSPALTLYPSTLPHAPARRHAASIRVRSQNRARSWKQPADSLPPARS